ncbi:hypothetical protein MAC_00304 [Metarhizium acridum CQMa 102]|uniref:Uncharacterized protein n=1 Tax=Metarhizium acridum (strain CQMa 102) TaxID=655827 RepID=E9DRD5_METAQ|nr:uncharacterized protein MAC_00304 [Metarhizium acridum CQMa 102]EFY93813.1 hypothetical protein MAC_00304 [Metarhizium acridum CQMa 102]
MLLDKVINPRVSNPHGYPWTFYTLERSVRNKRNPTEDRKPPSRAFCSKNSPSSGLTTLGEHLCARCKALSEVLGLSGTIAQKPRAGLAALDHLQVYGLVKLQHRIFDFNYNIHWKIIALLSASLAPCDLLGGREHFPSWETSLRFTQIRLETTLFTRHGPVTKTTNIGVTIYITNDAEISRYVLGEGESFTRGPGPPRILLTHYTTGMSRRHYLHATAPRGHFPQLTMSPRAVTHYAPLVQDATRPVFKVLDQLSDQKLEALYLAIDTTGSRNPSFTSAHEEDFAASEMTIADEMDVFMPGTGLLSLEDPTTPIQAACVEDFLSWARGQKVKLPEDILLGNVVVLVAAGFTTTSSLL